MGAGSIGVFEHRDTGRLIGRDARRQPRLDIGHALDARTRLGTIKVSVEHAAVRPELKLEPDSLAHLERGIAEMADQLGRG